MTSPAKPWKAEYAKSGRSSCKTCKLSIDKERLRLGKMVQSTHFDGLMPMWNHVGCILKKAKQIKSVDDVEGLDSLRWEDQQKIRKYIDDGVCAAGAGGDGSSTHSKKANVEYGVEVSQTSRATCRDCNQKIVKGEVRISSNGVGQGARGLSWHHSKCMLESLPSIQVENLVGWEKLSSSDQTAVLALVKKDHSSVEAETTLKPGTKRKNVSSEDQKSKVAKTGENVTSGEAAKNHGNSDTKLEAQTKALWDLKDDLKKHVTTAELREMLELNDQDSSGSELDLRDRCADGMLFGVLGRCPICSGFIRYSGGVYQCQGFLSEWSKCSFSTREPERLKEKWKVPEATKNDYLSKWFKSQKVNKPPRILSPSLDETSGPFQSSEVEDLADLKVAFVGLPREYMDEWKRKVEGAGGQIHAKVKKGTNCLVVSQVFDHENAELKKARRMKIPIVRDDYLVQCYKRQKKLPFNHYKVEASGGTSGVVTVKVKGRSAVHEASGLQDTGHILEDGKSIYNTTLNMSDLSTGVNSYYILQIIEADNGTECYVFRKWGRVGNEKIGGFKLDEFPKDDAICEFRRLFLEKTGNSWDAWEEKKNFQKKPGKFFPLEIDYGINKQVSNSKMNSEASRLPPPVVELMTMLFNVETYRAAMREFEINMSEMPLGKLSRSNIRKGFQALTDIQTLLTSSVHNPAVRESLIVDASNRFFTVIPSIHPHVIKDEDDFKSKVKMLEALQDIEIASRLVGFDADLNDSLDEKYCKLHCHIAPLPHDTEDFQLIEKYLQNTHAPTHTEWSLQLEDVFSLEREGESDKFLPFREKLKNKMLLWHGSRLTNFVGILSQGLRIAPPEAPATGYMFGKGIYFADLVSKSAQYCYTDKKSPVGLMLLSEVALGEVYELKKAMYMEKPPEGKHSTKGLGKKVPHESEFVKWRNDVTVPCGKPVSSNVRASELMYNEYIVYNTAQVKLQFLLKVRFHHKK